MTVGQHVICINDSFSDVIRQLYQQLPIKDVTYTIREISMGRGVVAIFRDGKKVENGGNDYPEVRVLLCEIINPPDPFCSTREMGFNAERFAPIEEEKAPYHQEIAVYDFAQKTQG
jgi:hypothetical protein